MSTWNQIWCLFSISNDYNQPKNNLIAWFSEKPSKRKLVELVKPDLQNPDVDIEVLWDWMSCRINDSDYRLSHVSEWLLTEYNS